ncbi:MAG: cytochrome c [Planctomycetota bacterium]
MTLNQRSLSAKCPEELDALFRDSALGAAPDGEGTGAAMLCPGTWHGRFLTFLIRVFIWQGKVVNRSEGTLKNRVSPFGFRDIKANVVEGPSRLDGKPCYILDYSKTSLIARAVRDEVREIAPGLYLGLVFIRKWRVGYFSLRYNYEAPPRLARRVMAATLAAILVITVYLLVRINRDQAVGYESAEDHFKYGSTGGERKSGIPLAIWHLLPKMFPEYLPGEGLRSLGFLYENGKDLPIGVSQRNVRGIETVFLNCAVCHVGTVRLAPDQPRQVVLGMPANALDLEKFERFLFACATDERFTGERIMAELERQGIEEDFINRLLLRYVGVSLMRDRLLMLRQRFLSFLDREPEAGPGRVDTFNSPKVLMNFPMKDLPEREWVGNCDLTSIWLQRPRRGMQLHWDGNNTRTEERNRSAAFGTGAFPTTLDRDAMNRIVAWLEDAEPPRFPQESPLVSFDKALAKRGQPLYMQYCSRCHGNTGRDFSGELVGMVTPIQEIGTDPHRLDSYTAILAANQNSLYAGYPDERFRHFRKTFGYANQPLDGIWLRAPYLHNGSVPTLRDLMEPASRRPESFFRGYDVFDSKRVGFVSSVQREGDREFFSFDTKLKGNGNQGHEGPEYGTELSSRDKDAIVEYMKTF